MNTGGQNRTELRLAAILAADVAGYSRLIGVDEEGTLHRLRSIRAEVIDPAIAAHRGRLVKTTGDGFLVEFASVVYALRCAVEIQRQIADHGGDGPADHRIELRIGIHQGDIVVEDGDIFGDGVNVAARLEALAEPGAICVSARVQEDAAGRLDLAFADLGEQNLKNIARPIRAYRVGPHKLSTPPAQAPLPLPDKPSIAVLPFQNISGDPEQEVFADGMVEDITTALSKLRWFFVIARNSSFAYKGRAVDVKQIGRELDVRYVLEGSVRKGGNRLRVTAQLVEAETGNHVWAERYDRDIGDIFAVQDEITERVVATIEPQLYAAEHFRSHREAPEHLDAWECVIQALSQMERGTIAGTEAAEKLYRRAIALAPKYAQAHSLLAWSLILSAIIGGGVTEMVPRAMSEVKTAIALDERDPWAHLVLGMLHWRQRRYPEAESALLRAIGLNPNFAVAHAALGFPLALQGKTDAAITSVEHALRLNPEDIFLGYFATSAMTVAHFAAGRYAEAIAWTRKTIEKRPEYPRSYALLMATAAMNGNFEAATEALDVHSRPVPHHSLAWERENMPFAGEFAERFLEGLRRAGVPKE
jgi:TolB-like protein/class 3 adenylate cyclase/Tfp pilus assembly protein PilF